MFLFEELDELSSEEKLNQLESDFHSRVQELKIKKGCLVNCLMTKWGLTGPEAMAVHDYKTNKCLIFNRLLINDREVVPELLNSAMVRLPKYGLGKVFRHDKKEHDNLLQHIVGECFKLNRFLSTSQNENFGDGYDFVIEIETSPNTSAVDFSKIWSICRIQENEAEVLFSPGTLFRIKSLENNRVILEETQSAMMIGNSLFSLQHLIL